MVAQPVSDTSLISSLLPSVVYTNRAAGGGRGHSSIPQIRKVFETFSVLTEFISVASAEELASAARAAIQSGTRLLFALGGDGTFQSLVNAAYGADVVLGVLPAGGGNDFAAGLGLPKEPAAAAVAMLRGQPRTVDLVRARTADGRVRFYAGGGGVGIDSEAALHANGAFRHWPGRSRYIASALRAFCGYSPLLVKAEFPAGDCPSIESTCLLVAVLNTPTYGAGIRLAPDASMDDGWLDAAVVRDLSLFQVLIRLPRLLKRGELRAGDVKRLRVRSMRITTDRPCMFHGDGEILGPTPVEIEVMPQAMRVLAPLQH
ncbi:MAG TPA: diacylglycerol kinase family protein [Candidatus Solibacter sp.]|nr:diacylglycerol kinase family protein [Candidatus Solibacter sp.]